MPGYVDVHVHGGGGDDFGDGPAAARRAARFHGLHGTTSLLAGLSTAGWERMCSQVAELAAEAEDPRSQEKPSDDVRGHAGARIVGTFLEGPFLSVARKGAHQPDLLRVPSEQDVSHILRSGQGSVSVVTVAPEIDHGLDAVGWLTAAGVRVSLGHSDADGEQFAAGIAAGGSCLTHTF